MIFKSLFKPKWLHHDAQIRKRALQALDFARAEDYAVLMAALRSDVDLQVRQSVLKRVVDLDTLWELAQNDAHAEISAAAAARFANLLSGAESSSLTFEQRLQRFALITDAKLIEQMALEGRERELRSAAMQRIEREGLLGDIALKDADVELRVVAVQRIKQKSTLERVAKQARIKDKRVSAIAREKLATLAADEERPALLRQQARQVCITLDALVRSKDWSTAGARLSRIDADWSAILAAWEGAKDGPLDTELTARYAAGRSAFNRAFAEYEQVMARQQELDTHSAAIRGRKQDLCAQIERMLDKLQGHTAPMTNADAGGDEGDLRTTLQTLSKAWSEAGSLALSEEQSFQLRFGALVAQLEAYAHDGALYHDAQTALAEITAQAEALLNTAAPVPAGEVSALEKRYRSIVRPVKYTLAADFDRRIVAALNQLRTRCEQHTQKLKQEVETVKRGIVEMEQALEAGQSQAAVELQKNVQKLYDALPESEAQGLRKQDAYRRWQAASKTIRELGSWKRWAGAPVKEHLVAEIESIVLDMHNAPDTARDYSAIAARIRTAREQWKGLGATDNAGAKALWERFNSACEAAFAPCAVHFEHERMQHAEHGRQKEIICQGLEQFIARTAWETGETAVTVDWKNVEHVLRSARKEWDAIGPLAHKQRNTLNMRFRVAMDDLALRLSAEKKLTQTKKEALIRRMEQLAESVQAASADSTAFQDAVAQAKQLQSQWKTLGQSAESNALWGKFRAASDALFARRQALSDAKDQERRANLELKQALCVQLEELASLQGDAWSQARGKVQQMKVEFERVGPIPKDAERIVLQRFKQACHALEQQDQACQQQKREQQVMLLQRKAQLCAELEQAADALVSGTLSNEVAATQMRTTQETWQASASLPDEVEKHIQARFQIAVETVHGLLGMQHAAVRAQLAQQRQTNLAAQELLCLRLEIAAGLESPEEYRQQRMQYQVDQLARRMQSGEFQDDGELRARGITAIKQQWLFIGAAPTERADALRARFERACAAPAFA